MFKVGDIIRCGCDDTAERTYPCPARMDNLRIIRIDERHKEYYTDEGPISFRSAKLVKRRINPNYICLSPLNKPRKESV